MTATWLAVIILISPGAFNPDASIQWLPFNTQAACESFAKSFNEGTSPSRGKAKCVFAGEKK